jgi:cytochrome P450
MALDLGYFEEHYTLKHPDLADHMWEVIDHMQTRCPVAHSDANTEEGGARGGVWIVTKYEDVLRVLQDWQTFSSDSEWMAKAETFFARLGDMPPITTDPPLQGDFRRLLNPFLAPQALAGYEPQIREIVTELIDDFIEDGRCDLVSQFAYLEPPRVLYRTLFGIEDEVQLEQSLAFTTDLSECLRSGDADSYARALKAWKGWVESFINSRRASARRMDMVDALLHGSVGGRRLEDEEISSVVRLLIAGGFFTTADATAFTMLWLAEHPEIQDELARNPSLLSKVIEETIRLDPSVISVFRVCTKEVMLRDKQMHRGDAVLIHFGGANRDPDEFNSPGDVQIDRERNRHLAFGAGPHRCIGSNLARLNLRIIFEEMLSRMSDIHLTEGEAARHSVPSIGWGLEYLPISFAERKRSGSA